MVRQDTTPTGEPNPANDTHEMDHEADAIFAHLELEKIESYRRGELSEEETERFREHVMKCEICQDYLGFLSLEIEPPSSEIADFQKEKAWFRLREAQRIQEMEAWHAKYRKAKRWAVGALCALILPLGGMVSQWSRIETMEGFQQRILAPQMNIPVFTLGEGNVRGPIELEAGDDLRYFTISFPVEDPAAGPGASYRVALIDAEGETLWEGDGLKVEFGYASLGLSRYFLEEGRPYQLEIFRSGTEERVGRHELRLKSES